MVWSGLSKGRHHAGCTAVVEQAAEVDGNELSIDQSRDSQNAWNRHVGQCPTTRRRADRIIFLFAAMSIRSLCDGTATMIALAERRRPSSARRSESLQLVRITISERR